MYFRPVLSFTRTTARRAHLTNFSWLRRVHTQSDVSEYDIKYADKLHQKANEKGVALDELKVQARQEARRKQKEEAEVALVRKFQSETILRADGVTQSTAKKPLPSPRKDSSPIKPLSSILNVTKLLATPHTSSQISALWTAYHASRSGGTGRGHICASLPLDAYDTMTNVAKRYSSFVLPLPRQIKPEALSVGDTSEPAHEFFYLQWDFHPPPSQPSATEPHLFQSVPPTPRGTALPPVSTVLFTPLQEYKSRNSFATPYLVLTFHTDLSHSHGLVLLRGEITPSAAMTNGEPTQDVAGRYLLNQVDAQLLAMGIQKYYLWGEKKGAKASGSPAEELLRRFHERPDDFDWQELLKQSEVTV
ncbi:ATP11-domain-containing protein [Pisolithus orientalis]|uniref:ATP11-domain-containing protein n=1 Tax=Pisolithus orientalis TaxID=936130 RepID=UPI0022243B82|nr:ATP11-domain-containing protein [Pisolithus orientalis]KAI6005030.1 ATP11-domain-containing protein [Pisolithus orientalis]